MSTDEITPHDQPTFPIVGIGASAGGLEALTELLHALDVNLGMAYVIVSHLDPIHPSTLPALLSQATCLPVSEVEDHMVVRPDYVYILPPNAMLTIERGVLKLHPRQARDSHLQTIDRFLSSLAEDQSTRAIGIILSGMGTDGTRGLQAIKEHRGITFVQALSSAKYPSMPESALLAGCVEYDDTPEGIAVALRSLAPHLSQQPERRNAHLDFFTGREEELHSLLRLLLDATDIDFTGYKPATVKRRLLRHLLEQPGEGGLVAYLASLREHPQAVEALAQDLLIHVTSFFRDPATFQKIEQVVWPRILERKAPGEAIRIWVMGCSTGEEVYSLAICLLEFLGERASEFPLSLFATDLDSHALEKARAGIYREQEMVNVSVARRERFFIQVDGGCQIRNAVRERCVFTQHNITRDPPFSRLDLISCRNVLIYLGTPLQKKILTVFHYALTTAGILLLGTSETVSGAPYLYTPLSEKHKLYEKKSLRTPLPLDLVIGSYAREERGASTAEPRTMGDHLKPTDLGKRLDQILLTHYLPTCVVIDHALEVVHLRGPASPYLTPASGQPSFNLLKMVHPDLALELRIAIAQVREKGKAMKKGGLSLHEHGNVWMVELEVSPVSPLLVSSSDLLLVVLRALPPVGEQHGRREDREDAASIAGRDARIELLEHERATLRTETTLLIEQLEELNQDLQVTSEELRSSNEELQSINEELETSKEELQVINEELSIANQKLHARNAQLQALRAYAEAIVETVREPLIVLDADLHIQQANQAFHHFFQTTKEESEGRLLHEWGDGEWNIPALLSLLSDVLPQDKAVYDFEIERHFARIGQKTLLLNARHILQQEQATAFILLAIEDITERRQKEKQEEVFLGIAGHELKTPVTSLKLYSELLLHRFVTAGDERAVSVLTRMDKQIDKLIRLIYELLDVTQLDAGHLPLHRQQADLCEIVRESVEIIERLGPTHTLVIEGAQSCLIDVDPQRIGQVVTNLVSNAIKYAPAGTLIRVSIAQTPDSVLLSVADRGPGIDAGKQQHLFERFSRLSDAGTVQETYPGLGLGLYIASEIVKRHGGRIWVESEKGRGATFFVALPLARTEEEQVSE